MAALLALSACAAPLGPTPGERERIEAVIGSPATLQRFLAGSTLRRYAAAPGTEVEYFAPDGRVFLWTPGSPAIVPGRWEARPGGGDPVADAPAELCRLYPPSTLSAVAGLRTGVWECRDGAAAIANAAEIVVGNPLGLGPGAAPYVLPGVVDTPLSVALPRAGAPDPRLTPKPL